MTKGAPMNRKTQRAHASGTVVHGRETFNAAEANADRTARLRRNELRRCARAKGLELRQSAYGYSLIDRDRQRVGDRNDLTLEEVAAHVL
jgi:hypothetical protein